MLRFELANVAGRVEYEVAGDFMYLYIELLLLLSLSLSLSARYTVKEKARKWLPTKKISSLCHRVCVEDIL